MANQHILQVSELTKKVRFILESELNTVWLSGEISNFVAASSGHWYLSLKDSKSQVRCAMFKGNNRRVRLAGNALPRNGQQVLVKARVSLYEPRGDFQLIIEQLDDAGEGLLRQRFEQLKSKLYLEGLFDQAFKQSIPAHINCVGIITSPTGAAVKDILTVLKRRNPNIKAIIYPALVQGDQASADICHAIAQANTRQECDVIIVGRGGGSLEDLWPFNEENVVRAIHASTLPTISAVGHEIDTTLSDHAADLRAPTPSAAAELVSQDTQALSDKINTLKHRLTNAFSNHFTLNQSRYNILHKRLSLVHPEQQLQLQQQRTDELTLRLKNAMTKEIQRFSVKPTHLSQKLMHLSPQTTIKYQLDTTQLNTTRLIQAMKKQHQQLTERFVHVIEQLQIVSPLATIARGYTVARNDQQQIIRSVEQINSGDSLTLQVSDGHILTEVKSTKITD